MKVTLYIRAGKHGRVDMWTRREEEPNYGDTVRIIGFGHDIAAELDAIIDKCKDAGAVLPPAPSAEHTNKNTQEWHMGKPNETIADIIAEKRRRAEAIERECAEKMKRGEMISDRYARELVAFIRREADRLEAAHKREKAAIEAAALAVGGIVEAARQKEAICTKCRDGEPPEDCRFFGEPDGCGSPTYGHYPQLPIGDCAKLREALSDACYAMFNFLKTQYGGYEEMANALDKAKAALAAPRRNCDVGTAMEQGERFSAYCRAHKHPESECLPCPLFGQTSGYCELAWAQMPCKEGGVK